MSHLLSLSRVARLVGLPRGTLQRMAQSGELATFDGQVELSEVQRVFPGVSLEDDSELRRVEEIKAAALLKPPASTELPDAGVLAGRLNELGRDYAAALARVRHYEIVHGWLEKRLEEAVERGHMTRQGAGELSRWLKRELATRSSDQVHWERLIAKERMMRITSAQVTVLPGRHAFEVEGNETLLEAGLRSGLSLAYGCSNGNCGECKVRVVTGEVMKVQPHDFVLTPAEKSQGYTLACAYAPVGDVSIEANLAGVKDIPEQTITTRVRAIEPLGSRVVALHLVTPRAERLRFLAGQRLRLAVGHVWVELPVASCPCEERRIEVHVIRDGAKAFADRVVNSLKPDAEVTITGPYGEFVLEEASKRPLLLIAAGEAGYAPIKSLVQHALSLDEASSITFYWLACPGGHYQENLARSYAAALDNFRYLPLTIGDNGAAALDDLVSRHGALGDCDVYAAGDADFLAMARARLLTAGLPADRWHAERVG